MLSGNYKVVAVTAKARPRPGDMNQAGCTHKAMQLLMEGMEPMLHTSARNACRASAAYSDDPSPARLGTSIQRKHQLGSASSTSSALMISQVSLAVPWPWRRYGGRAQGARCLPRPAPPRSRPSRYREQRNDLVSGPAFDHTVNKHGGAGGRGRDAGERQHRRNRGRVEQTTGSSPYSPSSPPCLPASRARNPQRHPCHHQRDRTYLAVAPPGPRQGLEARAAAASQRVEARQAR